eukprot:CAMPEP_0197919868 /NCGR_PEP_ID=MMETSP1439-20131203/87935_1 /TAXON_ID=66791 /ORGANISM="Gonyaulax spinifera, Strain CCMP409" /LENGTH=86 /DNA_ID=CAMNT_0043542045 /DNA_START=63 /DNA_END=319 /DNA_ORIENTATION=+
MAGLQTAAKPGPEYLRPEASQPSWFVRRKPGLVPAALSPHLAGSYKNLLPATCNLGPATWHLRDGRGHALTRRRVHSLAAACRDSG